MRDAFKETGQRLWRLAIPFGGTVVSLKFGELVTTARANWTLVLHEVPPAWLTEIALAPWVQPALVFFICASLLWTLWPAVRGVIGWIIASFQKRRGAALTKALSRYGVVSPANRESPNNYIVGGRAEDERGVTIGPMPTAEASRRFEKPGPEYIPLEDAGRWLYENASQRIRDTLKGGVPSPFDSIAEHGAAFYRTAWLEGYCSIYGRWEPGLPMELIDPKDGDFSAFESVFGSDRRRPIDLSVMRQDLKPVLDYYEQDEPTPSRETVKVLRNKPLQEALMFIAARQWHLDPMTDGGNHLTALSAALVDFRQHASDGTITVWGKADRYGVWQRIEPQYWVNHYVDLLDVLSSGARARAYNKLAAEPLFQDLMVCRAEFELAWREA